jgi:hypothetical protein
VVGRNRPAQDDDFAGLTNLPNQIAGTLRDCPAQDLVTLLRHPHEVILDIAQGVPALPIFSHPLYSRRGLLKADRLKAVGLDLAMETKRIFESICSLGVPAAQAPASSSKYTYVLPHRGLAGPEF